MITEKTPVKIEYFDLCRNCRGAGNVTDGTKQTACPVCLSHGRVLVKKEIKITIQTL